MDGGQEMARNLGGQEPGRGNYVTKGSVPPIAGIGRQSQRFETADDYSGVVVKICDGWRVIICKTGIQWVLQRRENGTAERPWRALGYCRTRKALMRLCGASCGRIDPVALAILAALPENFGGDA